MSASSRVDGKASVYRSRGEIELKILELLEKGPTSKTKIMYDAYLSYAQLKQYLVDLIADGLIETKDGVYSITAKGRHYAKNMREAVKVRQARS